MSAEFRHGASLVSSDVTQFRLWAPNADRVAVELNNGDVHPLQGAANGWHEVQLRCRAGTRYRFIIDNRVRVPDPASRYQPDGVHGFSEVVDTRSWHESTSWGGRPWYESVIYEAHVGLLGGYAGVATYLPYLKSLGVTALQLMPLAEFPGDRNWGYDGVYLFAPHHSYGSPDALRALVDAAHAQGLMVFIDVVYNHFGPDGNYLHEYADDFFRQDISTPWGAAIDFRRQEVTCFFVENALMWLLDYQVDGLRLDAVHAIYHQEFPVEFARRVREALAPGRQVHLILENEHNAANLLDVGYDAQWNDDGHHVLHTILTGETGGYYVDFVRDSSGQLARFLAQGFVFQGQLTSAGVPRGQPSAHLPPTAFVLFLQNHDQIGNRAFGERLITLAPRDKLTAAVALMLLSPMVPMLFMGEERGSRQPFYYFTDHMPELAQAVREGRRNEFSRFPQFASDPQTIPDPNATDTFTQSQPYGTPGDEKEPDSWLEFYTKLLDIRHRHIVPGLADVRSLGASVLGTNAVAVRWTLAGRQELGIALNLGDKQVSLPDPVQGEHILYEYRADTNHHQLPPGSILVTLDASSGGMHD